MSIHTPSSFLEALFETKDRTPAPSGRPVWVDRSTPSQFIFESTIGIVRLQKRSAYPTTFAYLHGNKLFFGYGKYDPKNTRQLFDYNHDYSLAPPEEYLWCEADPIQGTVTIERDIYCTVPLFASNSHGRLVLSNHYDRVCKLSRNVRPHASKLGLLDILLSINTREFTWREDVHILLERQRAIWRDGEFRTEPRDDVPYSQLQSECRTDPRQFKQYLEATLDSYWQRYAKNSKVAFELSGGIDSPIAPGYYATQGQELTTATIAFPGNFAVTQQAKLRDFFKRFDVKSTYIVPLDIERHHPLAELTRSGTWRPFAMYADMYAEAHRELADKLCFMENTETIFTGIGGDEMCANAIPRRRPLEHAIQRGLKKAPSFFTPLFHDFCNTVGKKYSQTIPSALQVLPLCTIQTAENRNNTYLDRGIWPVTPFSDPRLYRYSQGLPVRYRANKNILRAYHHALRSPESIYKTGHNEHFGDFFTHTVVQKLEGTLKQFLEQSVLEREGFLDKQELLRQLRAVKDDVHPDPKRTAFELYKILVTEINLQVEKLCI